MISQYLDDLLALGLDRATLLDDSTSFQLLKGDMGSRSFWRVSLNNQHKSFIFCTYLPKDHPKYTPGHDLADVVRLTSLLSDAGIRVPSIYQYDLTRYIALIEDLGDTTLLSALKQGYDNGDLTQKAADILVQFHHLDTLSSGQLPDFFGSHVFKGNRRFVDWFAPAFFQRQSDDDMISSFLKAWDDIFVALPKPDMGFVHMDFHFENLMLDQTDDFAGKGVVSPVLLDFQGANYGPIAYDLTNLLQDARRDVPQDLQDQILSGVLSPMPADRADSFTAWYHTLACHFHCRVAGQFIKMTLAKGLNKGLNDGDDIVYLPYIPRLLHLIHNNCQRHNVLRPMQIWLDRFMPDDWFERWDDFGDGDWWRIINQTPSFIRPDAF